MGVAEMILESWIVTTRCGQMTKRSKSSCFWSSALMNFDAGLVFPPRRKKK